MQLLAQQTTGRFLTIDRAGRVCYVSNMGDNLEIGNNDRALARRLAALRREAGLTLDVVEERSGVSRATLSRIERGETSPTAHVLGRLCTAYKVTMSELLLSIEEGGPRCMPRSQATQWRDPETGFSRAAISPPAKGYSIELVWAELPPRTSVHYDEPPMHGMEQHVVLFEGELRLTLGEDQYHLRRDDCLRTKLYTPVSFFNPGRSTARYLLAIGRP